ncbi:helix-turn-helix transcriptional regulator [Streptomonospora wellingtoniae]|uniref:helix-turn-helix transcriptional regulator n=1 Tax=Streptomonospora wellingtoniae TaxID=3075544 RepID=UPI00288BFE42|nr:helix-turn-helix transcriptional regulator [Streptomonospora sp. DSM 45055]
MSEPDRSGLGAFLRSRRERLAPQDVGLPERGRRRTPGLRREEVAELAGIGTDWYIRLEQGRSVIPSPATVGALAAALRLDAAEQAHLQALAGAFVQEPFVRERAPDGLRNLVETLDRPAYLTGRRWDLLAWSPAAADLFADFGAWAEEDRNVLVYLLLDPGARRLFGHGWADQARHLVGRFRAARDLRPADPAFDRLTARLLRGCPEFGAWWDRHDVREAGGAGTKVLHTPDRGALRFDYATFQADEDPALCLTVYTQAGRQPQPPAKESP